MSARPRLRIVFALVLLPFLLVAACRGDSGQPVTDAERAQVLTYADPKTDKLLAAYNTDDYAAFSADFDDAMRKGIPAEGFADLRATLMPKIGEYQSREVTSVQTQSGFYVVLYRARFTQDDAVTVRVVFTQTPEHNISGLWFDSPKLR